MSTASHTATLLVTEAATFIGIDCHKKYSVWHAVDALLRKTATCPVLFSRLEVRLAEFGKEKAMVSFMER